MGVLLGINKVALRYQWVPYVHLSPCHVVGPLWLFLSTPDQMAGLPWSKVCWAHPPTHPPPRPSTPLIHDTRDITETFQKTFTKPVILTSCQLVYIMLAITLVYYWSKSGVATIKHQRNTVPETRIPRDMCAGNTIPGETRIPMTPLSEEIVSARKMCPGGHIFLGNSVLSGRIYCPP